MEILPPIKRRSEEEETSRRGSTFVLKLRKDGVCYRVCKKMFLNTLNIGEWSLHSWVKNKHQPVIETNQAYKINPRRDLKQMVRTAVLREFAQNGISLLQIPKW